ncbi:MBL fold metallo-hydrolase [Fictibacillus fluitans]|uniref:MBL fold metallo-hydrolase n=1 Tax=Fictibacillus fluitans TaxID=3058422 RepID=A0ABT8HWS2_9BACL|nr:MBL fold metallo-hydrolase [Fictibacillus sp. NE201]MDN4525232.1 MBL fold metallo-hydrolase [Fictibacillus sp. NE201]
MKEKIMAIELPTPFLVGNVNVYLIAGEKLTLVDCGPRTPGAWSVFREKLQGSGVSVNDIKQIIFTHYHPDHVGLYAYFDSPAPVLASKEQIPYLCQDPQYFLHRNQFYESFYKKSGMPREASELEKEKQERYLGFSAAVHSDILVSEGKEIPGLPGWGMIKTPGHSPDHLSLFHEESGTMIGGDFLLQRVSSNALIEPPEPGEMDRPRPLLQYRESLRKAAVLPIRRVLPGHGDDITNCRGLIRERLKEQNNRAEVLRTLLAGKMTAYELSRQLFPRMYKKEPGLTLSETVGHLDLLEAEGKVKIEQIQGVEYYRKAE